jgi:hypothetical protein
MTQRTDTYVDTYPVDNNLHWKIGLIRKVIKNSNKKLRSAGKDEQFFVRVRGRLGKNNPNAPLYHVGGELYQPYSEDIKLQHATRVDVYVSQRTRNR